MNTYSFEILEFLNYNCINRKCKMIWTILDLVQDHLYEPIARSNSSFSTFGPEQISLQSLCEVDQFRTIYVIPFFQSDSSSLQKFGQEQINFLSLSKPGPSLDWRIRSQQAWKKLYGNNTITLSAAVPPLTKK